MLVKCTHINTGLIVFIRNENLKTSIEGNEILVDSFNDYLNRFRNTVIMQDALTQLRLTYGDLVVNEGSLYSVDTNNPKFITSFMIPEIEEMGYLCKLV